VWAAGRHLDAVVWTALPPKLNGIEGTAPPTRQAVIDYLRGLADPVQTAARQYVERVPTAVRTPFRAAIEAEFGWLPRAD
jgi:hypothetical protein